MKKVQVLCILIGLSFSILSCKKNLDESNDTPRILPIKIVHNFNGTLDSLILSYDSDNRLVMCNSVKFYYNSNSHQSYYAIGKRTDTVNGQVHYIYDTTFLSAGLSQYSFPMIGLGLIEGFNCDGYYQNPNTLVLYPYCQKHVDSIFLANENIIKISSTAIGTINNGHDSVYYGHNNTDYTYSSYLNPFKNLNSFEFIGEGIAANKNLPSIEGYYTDLGPCCAYYVYNTYTFDTLNRLTKRFQNSIPASSCGHIKPYTRISTYYY